MKNYLELLAALLIAPMFGNAGFVSASAADLKPNIVFILTDDQGYGDLGCYGSATIATPNVDRLCAEGMKFESFYVHNRCSPTRIVPTTPADNYWGRGVRLYYPDGTVVRLESKDGPALGGIFIGQRGRIEINRGRFACNPADLLAPFEGPDTESHVANWLDCVQSRKDPNAPVEVGHLITSVSHLINICRIVGRPIEWDAANEQITNDEEANDLLTKVRRPEFALPTS